MGFAVDYTNASRVRTNLQASLDGGLLSAATNTSEFGTSDDAALKEAIKQRLRAFLMTAGLPQEITDTLAIDVALIGDGIEASAKATVETNLLRVINIDTIDVGAKAAVIASSAKPVEVALALDVTDSMIDNMADLRSAAQNFVDKLTSNGSSSAAKIALVPFVGAVNIGTPSGYMNWIDTEGDAKYNAINLRNIYVARKAVPECPSLDDGEVVGGGGDNDNGWLEGSPWQEALDRLAGIFQVSQAQAHPAAPYKFVFYEPCDWVNPKKISNTHLFELIGVPWKGCVEARPEPLDVNDTPPSASNPDTLWPAYFWPDGPDLDSSPDPEVSNNYLIDTPYPADSNLQTHRWGRAYSIEKYRPGKTLNIDETPPYMKGPNRACPDPVLPLTNDYDQISARISSLQYYEGSGTNTAEGVAWGMRVLSPGAPFTEGAPYGDIDKIMVLLSDGNNGLIREDVSPFGTHYSSYGSLRYGRIPNDTNVDAANAFLDDRMSLACTNAKNAGIEIYVIALGVNDAYSRQLLRNCATDSEHTFEVGRSGSLEPAFAKIAKDLANLRLTR
ncbi:hypothetical protein GCM10007276_11160 [Agaricicola taiwanensis]|uniref:VWFA domain-containing protein n=2 Tax=Agaricicola taiwanensis TaxID=591372 RepID=A0A8J2VQ76_9RHOB|nr:hypothetical protein GCM10007276_11160 [Agaricicola taiwanensis]